MSSAPLGLVDYTNLAADYETARIGYSSELYATMYELGLAKAGALLDVGCGTGLACEPLANNGAKITGVDSCEAMLTYARLRIPAGEFVRGPAEALPFPNASFAGAICAQAFHWFDREKAMAELVRVVKPGGAIAIWWKHLMSDNPVNRLRDEVLRDLAIDLPDPSLLGGFVEFYRAPLREHTLRVAPWRMAVPLDRFMASERSRCELVAALGSKLETYTDTLSERLQETYGTDNPFLALGYMQYLYVGKKI